MASHRPTYVSHCEPCEKRFYADRKAAKQAIRGIGGARMRAYPCPVQPELYHIGHLPHRVVNGDLTAGEYYERREAS